jgi:hypothetical protein
MSNPFSFSQIGSIFAMDVCSKYKPFTLIAYGGETEQVDIVDYYTNKKIATLPCFAFRVKLFLFI